MVNLSLPDEVQAFLIYLTPSSWDSNDVSPIVSVLSRTVLSNYHHHKTQKAVPKTARIPRTDNRKKNTINHEVTTREEKYKKRTRTKQLRVSRDNIHNHTHVTQSCCLSQTPQHLVMKSRGSNMLQLDGEMSMKLKRWVANTSTSLFMARRGMKRSRKQVTSEGNKNTKRKEGNATAGAAS